MARLSSHGTPDSSVSKELEAFEMTAGHFGLAAAVKAPAPRIPLWALMLSTYLLDVVFIILVAIGIESFAPIDPAHPAYGETLIHAYYSHSLVGAALLAIIAGLLASRAWGRQGALVIGGIVFSHWLLDLLVHRPDLPILPGNVGNLPLLGFGLWNMPFLSAAIEFALAVGGAYLYYTSARQVPASSSRSWSEQRMRALTTAGITGLLVVLLLASDVFGLPLIIAILLMFLLIVFCGWLDSRLGRPAPNT